MGGAVSNAAQKSGREQHTHNRNTHLHSICEVEVGLRERGKGGELRLGAGRLHHTGPWELPRSSSTPSTSHHNEMPPPCQTVVTVAG